MDEAGLDLLPGLVRTYAPEAHTPVIREKQTRDHLSVMGGMTPEGKVYALARQESLNGLHCVEFLQHLLRVAGPRLLVIWDGSPMHRRAAVQEFVVGTHGKVWVEALPGYAPDLNPVEMIWAYLKHGRLANFVPRHVRHLDRVVVGHLTELRGDPALIRSLWAGSRLPFLDRNSPN